MIDARITRDGAREEGDSNSGQGVKTGKNSLTPGEIKATSRQYFVDTPSVTVVRRKFNVPSMAVAKLSGLPEDYPAWSKRPETFASMRKCLISLLVDTEKP